MNKESAYQRIAKHIRPKFYKKLNSHIEELETLIRDAYKKYEDYKSSKTRTFSEYVSLVSAIDRFSKDKRTTEIDTDTLGMYDTLSQSNNIDIRSAMKQLHSRLAQDGINLNKMISETMLVFPNYDDWAKQIGEYYSSMNGIDPINNPFKYIPADVRQQAHEDKVTLRDYITAREIAESIKASGDNGMTRVILPMKEALSKYRMTLFDAIKLHDPVAESYLATVKDYEARLNADINIATSQLVDAPSECRVDSQYGKKKVVSTTTSPAITEYMRVYDTIYSEFTGEIERMYTTPLSKMMTYKYPDSRKIIQDIVNNNINSSENPSNQ